MFNFKPKEDIFFKMFIEAAQNAHNASLNLNKLANDYANSKIFIEEIINIEANGDRLKHDIEVKLENTFITPFDREDIFQIIKKLDRYVNFIESIALRFQMLHIEEVTETAKEISQNLVHMTEQLIIIMENLHNKKNSEVVKNAIIKVNGLETNIDYIFRNAINELFENPADVLYVVKWKELYQYFEDTSDSCEEVATAIEGVVAKYE